MRFTIERIRTLVLAAGVLLVAAIAVYLAIDKFKNPLNRRDIPKRLGIDIQQEANGITYTQAHGGHTIFKIHASKVVQLRNNHATLHDVEIDLYGPNGSDHVLDRIQGDEFDYDQQSQTATAAGPVEITLQRPAPAGGQPAPGGKSAAKATAKPPLPNGNNEIHVETSGLVFNQQSGMVTTTQRVQFSTARASGSSVGASYDTDRGYLVLDSDVELTATPTAAAGHAAASPVELRARHAEFDRDAEICYLTDATATTRGEQASAAQAQVVFRDDGTAESLQVSGGFSLSTPAGSRLTAPAGAMQFNDDSQPRQAHLEGGVKLSSVSPGRRLSGASPTMDLSFNADGELRHAHLERGVEMAETGNEGARGTGNDETAMEVTRTWRSPVADVDFRQGGRGQVEPAMVHGTGGVVVTSESRRGSETPVPSELAADEVTGQFGPEGTLSSLTGTGHARLQQTAASGSRQTATGDRLQAQFAPLAAGAPPHGRAGAVTASLPAGSAQIETAELDGHVTLVQEPAARTGAKPEPPLRATAAHALYESAGQWLHLTGQPMIDDGGMELTATKIDVSQSSGDAFAHGNVKGTWMDSGSGQAASASQSVAPGANPVTLGGSGPAHVIAADAEFHSSSGEASFRGHARLWQQDNSIAGPLLVVNRQKQTLVATAANAAEPVVVVLLSAGDGAALPAASAGGGGGSAAPSVIRVRGGDLWYSGAERKAILRAAPLAAVVAQSGAAESSSDQVELYLAPAGAPQPAAGGAAQATVDRMVATGHVVLTSLGRRGSGSELVYTARSGQYVLTGTAAAPPRMTDPQRGSVTGNALIFNSRDDSVSIEGGGRETTTETVAPR